MSGVEGLAHTLRALRLDADDPRAGPQRLHRERDAGNEPAAADRHDDQVDLGHVLDDLQAEARVAGDDVVVVERVQEVEAGRLELLDHREELRHLGREADLAAVAARGFDLRPWRALGHDDRDVNALRPSGVRDRLGRVPRAHRHHPGALRLGRQARHRVHRPPHLERAGALEVLELEVRLGADPFAQRAARDEGRSEDVPRDRRPGEPRVGEPDGHRSTPQLAL